MVAVIHHCEVMRGKVSHGVMKGSCCCCTHSSNSLGAMSQFWFVCDSLQHSSDLWLNDKTNYGCNCLVWERVQSGRENTWKNVNPIVTTDNTTTRLTLTLAHWSQVDESQ